MKLSAASTRPLQSYLNSRMDLNGLYEYLIGAEYNQALTSEERDALASIRALALDVVEERRSKSELDGAIRTLIKSPAPSRSG